jgi:AraC-like DNA-binding protein
MTLEQVARELNLSESTIKGHFKRTQDTLKKKIAQWEIDVSHFTGQRWKHSPSYKEKYTPDILFVNNSDVSN